MQTQYCGIGRFRRTQANRAIVILIKWYIYLQNILYSRLHHSLFHTVSRSTLFRLLIHTHYSAFRLQIHTVVIRLTLALYTIIPHALSLSSLSFSHSLTFTLAVIVRPAINLKLLTIDLKLTVQWVNLPLPTIALRLTVKGNKPSTVPQACGPSLVPEVRS